MPIVWYAILSGNKGAWEESSRGFPNCAKREQVVVLLRWPYLQTTRKLSYGGLYKGSKLNRNLIFSLSFVSVGMGITHQLRLCLRGQGVPVSTDNIQKIN